MNTKHTPGPWHLDGATLKGCREDMYPILLDAEGSGLSDADLRLIAAAPDLLEALRAIEALADSDDPHEALALALQFAQSAIAKVQS